MLELYLIRHPKTLGGENIIKGHLDVGLESGWETDVDALAAELANKGIFNAFFSSDLQRARLPAERIVAYLRNRQKKPLEFKSMELLRERNVGILQGKKREDVDTKRKGFIDYILGEEYISGGESKSEAIERVKTFVAKYLQKYVNSGGRVGIVGHGWWINYLINFLLNDYSGHYNQIKNLEMIRLVV